MIPFFLPKIKQKKNKKKGKLIDPKTGLAFLGPFLLDHLGNFFKGKTLTKDSEPLVFDPDEKEDITVLFLFLIDSQNHLKKTTLRVN